MKDSISHDLLRITEGAEKLNAQADAVTRLVTDLSKYLQELQVGLDFSYIREMYKSRIEISEKRTVPCCYYVGFNNTDSGKWCIAVVCKVGKNDRPDPHLDDQEKSENETLWVRPFEACSREVRLGLAPFVPHVIHGLAQAVEYVLSSVDASLGNLEKVQKELQQVLSKSRK